MTEGYAVSATFLSSTDFLAPIFQHIVCPQVAMHVVLVRSGDRNLGGAATPSDRVLTLPTLAPRKVLEPRGQVQRFSLARSPNPRLNFIRWTEWTSERSQSICDGRLSQQVRNNAAKLQELAPDELEPNAFTSQLMDTIYKLILPNQAVTVTTRERSLRLTELKDYLRLESLVNNKGPLSFPRHGRSGLHLVSGPPRTYARVVQLRLRTGGRALEANLTNGKTLVIPRPTGRNVKSIKAWFSGVASQIFVALFGIPAHVPWYSSTGSKTGAIRLRAVEFVPPLHPVDTDRRARSRVTPGGASLLDYLREQPILDYVQHILGSESGIDLVEEFRQSGLHSGVGESRRERAARSATRRILYRSVGKAAAAKRPLWHVRDRKAAPESVVDLVRALSNLKLLRTWLHPQSIRRRRLPESEANLRTAVLMARAACDNLARHLSADDLLARKLVMASDLAGPIAARIAVENWQRDPTAESWYLLRAQENAIFEALTEVCLRLWDTLETSLRADLFSLFLLLGTEMTPASRRLLDNRQQSHSVLTVWI